MDLAHYEDNDIQRWREQYTVYNLGPKAVGNPVITSGGGVVTVLDPRKITDYLDAEKVLRDQIVASFGVPPAKVGIIETGNIGGGTGEAQNKSFQVNTIIPVANLLLEKLNYHLVQQGFGIEGWHLEFEEIDFRDSLTVEQVRDMRLKNGSYSLNEYRAELGKPPVDGGDTNIVDTRTGIVSWLDMEAMSKATIANKTAPLTAAGVNGYVPGVPDALEPEPVPSALAGVAPSKTISPLTKPGMPDNATQGKPPVESYGADTRSLEAAWERAYRARRKEALRALPGPEKGQ